MKTISQLYLINAHSMSRADFYALRRNARRARCSFKVGQFYIGPGGVAPCDRSGILQTGIWHKLQSAQWARAQVLKARGEDSKARWIKAAREILALPHSAPIDYWKSRFQ
jgi:hypothetical protein